jgi:hypothetical protein
MHIPAKTMVAGTVLLTCLAGARADEAADKLEALKKKAQANWALLDAGEAVLHESAHLLLVAPKGLEKRLKEIDTLLEKSHGKAVEALGMNPKESPWPVKLTVYLVSEREHYTTFVRRVEKRRLEGGETGSFDADGDEPHAIGSPPRSRNDPGIEAQAAQQLAAALLQKKAGRKVLLPGWLVLGFGRATYARVNALDVGVRAERARAADLVVKQKRTAAQVWGGDLDGEESSVLGFSLSDYLAYGPGSGKFPAFVEAFKPDEGQEKKTTDQVLAALNIKGDKLDSAWKAWVPKVR